MSGIDLEKLLFGQTTRVRYVIRFGTCHRMRDESVAEHSFFVGFYSMMLGKHIRLSDAEMAELLQRALLHDIEEAVSGDFPRPFKHGDKELKKALDIAGQHAFEQAVDGLLPAYTEDLERMWVGAKEGKIGRILAFADFLAVLAYLCQEVEASNRTMKRQCDEMKKYWADFAKADYEFIRDLVNQSGAILGRIML